MVTLPQFRPGTSSDSQLIRACLRGDDAAWANLIDRYSGLVYSVIRRYRLSEPEALDVFQDVWVSLWEQLGTLRDHARLGPWLMTVAGRLAWGACKRRARLSSSEPIDNALATAPEAGPGPEQLAAEREASAEVNAALASISPRCRLLIHALFCDPTAPTYAEIAERLGCSENSVGPIRGRCFRELRAALETRRR